MPLADNAPEKWMYKKHTQVKHEILEKYLGAWLKILGKYHKVCYFDCFAGRGVYTDGEIGSPLVALRTASELKKRSKYLKEIELTFIEKDKDNYDNLVSVINEEISQNPSAYEGIIVKDIINNEFANVSDSIIQTCTNPSFFFIDPFGFSGIPIDTIKKILAIPKTEVFINFMIQFVYRFLESGIHARSIEELYGISDVNSVVKNDYSNMDLESGLLKLYRNQLRTYADVNFAFPFKVNADEKKQTTYYLIHGTNSFKGYEVMKNVMSTTGTKGRFGYLGPAEGQMDLGRFDNKEMLKNYLMDNFAGQSLCFDRIRMKTANDLACTSKDYKDALLRLENEAKIIIDGKGSRGGIGDKCLIHFDNEKVRNTSINEDVPSINEDAKEEEEEEKHSQASLFDF